ncbi:MAG: tRNA (adenosine(37)-N6)-threonylcarbamoyltransferase complex transferase subunit TsaD [Lentisphaeria bacterium]|jgi:N6-L-threonylcarbamoyladenine synthase
MNILGIETSCDETAAAVVADGDRVLSSVISSQIQAHAAYGGVVPELAAREHLTAIGPVVETALAEAGMTLAEIGGLAVTSHPGLVPALLVGVAYAKGLALSTGKPLAGVNHTLAHIYGAFLGQAPRLRSPQTYPILALAVSGGHTLLLLVTADGAARVLGSTIDDAAGEAFDKAAKLLGLGYPGGPVIDRLAKPGNPAAVAFPRSLLPRGGHALAPGQRLQFSFSGLKTALLYHVQKHPPATPQELADVVASYQAAVVEVLVEKTRLAALDSGARTVVLCGGVACNSALRAAAQERIAAPGRELLVAPPKYCTDNAAMVAGLGWHQLRQERADDGLAVAAAARLPLALGRVPFAPATADA